MAERAHIKTVEEAVKVNEDKSKKYVQPVRIDNLAAYIRRGFDAARDSRSTSGSEQSSINDRLIRSKRQVNSIYDPEILSAIEEFGGSKDYDPLTIQKCLTAEAWLKDILASAEEKPWGISPTPIAELPPEVEEAIEKQAFEMYQDEIPMEVQEDPSPEAANYIGNKVMEKAVEIKDTRFKMYQEEARERAARMERIIHDQMVEGGFIGAFDDFLQNVTRSLVGVIKGPVPKRYDKLISEKDEEGNITMSRTTIVKKHFYAIKAEDMYLSPTCLDTDKGDINELMHLQSSTVQSLIGVPGYNEAAIRAVLRDYAIGGLRKWTEHRWEEDNIENRPNAEYSTEYNAIIDAIDFWGEVPGRLLKQWEMEGADDEDKYYSIHAILIGRHVILAEMNADILGRKPYHITSFEKQSGSIYGRGIPEKIRSSQRAANVCRRALINNVSISSGPQMIVNTDALPPGEEITQMHPWKIHQVKTVPAGSNTKPIDFFQPNSNAQELMALLEKFYTDADRDTGIPRYVQGDQGGTMRGAAGTASGLSMLMNAASKSMKQVITNIDKDVIGRIVKLMYDVNMLDPEVPQEAKGDFEIVPKGALSLSIKEMLQVRRMEFLQLVVTNETLMGIIGQKGITALLRETIKTLDMPLNSVIPDERTIEEGEMAKYEELFGQVVQKAVEMQLLDPEVAQMLMNPEEAMQMLSQMPASPGQPAGGQQAPGDAMPQA